MPYNGILFSFLINRERNVLSRFISICRKIWIETFNCWSIWELTPENKPLIISNINRLLCITTLIRAICYIVIGESNRESNWFLCWVCPGTGKVGIILIWQLIIIDCKRLAATQPI